MGLAVLSGILWQLEPCSESEKAFYWAANLLCHWFHDRNSSFAGIGKSRASLSGHDVGLDQPKPPHSKFVYIIEKSCFIPPLKAEVNCILKQSERKRSDGEPDAWLCCISPYTQVWFVPLCCKAACPLTRDSRFHKQDDCSNWI